MNSPLPEFAHRWLHRLLGILAFLACNPAARGQEPPPLTSIAAVRSLPRTEAARGLPVSVRGVVTFGLRPDSSFVAQDDTAIWFSRFEAIRDGLISKDAPELQVGDRVEIEGKTASGGYAPIILPQHLRVLGHAPLPTPKIVTFSELQSGQYDTQRVTLQGVVQGARSSPFFPGDSAVALTVSTLGGKFNYTLGHPPESPLEGLVDAEISATGVCLPFFNNRGQLIGVRLVTSEPGDLVVLKPAATTSFAAPSVRLENLLNFSPAFAFNHRVRITGTVTASEPGQYVYIADGIRGLRVETQQTTELSPGDVVECAGFAELTQQYPVLREAELRVIATSPPPSPIATSLSAILAVRNDETGRLPVEDYDSRLVTLRGVLSSIEQRTDEPLRLYLESEGTLVPVTLSESVKPGSIRELRDGSELSVTGICTINFSRARLAEGEAIPARIALTLRSAEDVRLLRAPPWWTPERLWKALGAALGTLLLAFVWVAFLRLRVTERSLQLAEETRARREAEVEFDATLRERERLSADLHDTLEQTLTGVALQIHATQTAPNPERAARNLDLAKQMLGRSREEVRRSVWNLRAHDLEGRLLREALRHTCETVLEDTGIALEVGGNGVEEALSEFAAGNLLLLAKEAVTNAIKHAQPKRITIAVDYTREDVTLTVEDDGSGFDPATAPGPHEGHFGLSGMRERASRIGGTIRIQSTPGRGTTLVFFVPNAILR